MTSRKLMLLSPSKQPFIIYNDEKCNLYWVAFQHSTSLVTYTPNCSQRIHTHIMEVAEIGTQYYFRSDLNPWNYIKEGRNLASRGISSQPLTEFWRHILGTAYAAYRLCRGCLVVVAQMFKYWQLKSRVLGSIPSDLTYLSKDFASHHQSCLPFQMRHAVLKHLFTGGEP